MANKQKRIVVSLLVVIVLCLVVSAAVELTAHPLRHWLDDVIYDNYNHYLPCNRLPTYDEVQGVVLLHQDTLKQIERINPGQVFWQVEENNCAGKADLLFLYGGHADRVKIETIINGDRFFGVPYRLRNQ